MEKIKLKVFEAIGKFPKIKNKRKIFCLLIILFVLGDFFYWWKFYKTPPDKWDIISLNKPEYYEIKEVDGQTIIGNKKAGISFKIPKEWRIEIQNPNYYLALFTPGTIGEANYKKGIKQGCQAMISILFAKTDLKIIEQQLKDAHQGQNYPETYEIIRVAGCQALKNLTGIPALDLYGTTIYIPVTKPFKQSRLYYLNISSNSEDINMCKQEFEKFLETVVIK